MTTTFNFNGIDDQLIDLQIEALVGEIRAITDQMEMLEESVTSKKAKLRTLLTQRGENWKDDCGFARLVADSVRPYYDAKGLDALILRSDWWAKRLRPYRHESNVRGGVSVR